MPSPCQVITHTTLPGQANPALTTPNSLTLLPTLARARDPPFRKTNLKTKIHPFRTTTSLRRAMQQLQPSSQHRGKPRPPLMLDRRRMPTRPSKH